MTALMIAAAMNFVTIAPGHFHAALMQKRSYPAICDNGHEAHFGQVVQTYLDWMKRGKMDPLYIDNMLVKYHTIVEAWKKAQAVKR